MSTFQFHFPASTGATVTIPLPPELQDRDIEVSIKAHDRPDKPEWTGEDERRRQHLLKAIECAPVWTDEQYEEWLETRKWINESVAAREKMWNDLD